jgi:O-antigen ligase
LSFVREIIDALFKEIKSVLREYLHETEAAVKKRLQKLLITGIIVSILVSLVISLIGSAVLFLTIGQLKYLSTMMPVWEAWDIMGLTSGVIGAVLLVVLFFIIKKQLRTKQN